MQLLIVGSAWGCGAGLWCCGHCEVSCCSACGHRGIVSSARRALYGGLRTANCSLDFEAAYCPHLLRVQPTRLYDERTRWNRDNHSSCVPSSGYNYWRQGQAVAGGDYFLHTVVTHFSTIGLVSDFGSRLFVSAPYHMYTTASRGPT